MFFTYVLENQKAKLYIGQTNKLEDRLKRHNKNRAGYSKFKGRWNLIYKKEFDTREEAVQFERYLKSLKSSKYIRQKIASQIQTDSGA